MELKKRKYLLIPSWTRRLVYTGPEIGCQCFFVVVAKQQSDKRKKEKKESNWKRAKWERHVKRGKWIVFDAQSGDCTRTKRTALLLEAANKQTNKTPDRMSCDDDTWDGWQAKKKLARRARYADDVTTDVSDTPHAPTHARTYIDRLRQTDVYTECSIKNLQRNTP